MTDRKINNTPARHRILVAPLEWGLGHATRCIPLITELAAQNCEVFIAAEGATYSLLKQEFPRLTFLSLTGYRIKYSRNKYFLPWKLLTQVPKIAFTIYKENQWLKKIVKDHKIDAVISDNRFGMYHSTICSVYITHQLLIKTGNIFTESIAKKIHRYFINKYNECWVPDFKENGLAGKLSHPKKLPDQLKYIGALSRFKLSKVEKKYDLLITISGPEPQRTIFEDQILKDLKSYSGKVLFIRGMPDGNTLKLENRLLEIKNHLSAIKLNEAMLQSDIIVSRCGYTTIMDLVKLQKKAILIPTPGQTEQEYLAKFLMENQIFYTISQKDFVLQNALKEANLFPFSIPAHNMEQYKNIINQFVQSL
ncbi:MAG: glycosyltransferase [Chitinophagaceae bacterium]|nr:glycosyltransferase [Chitinophagaceae bacterium]